MAADGGTGVPTAETMKTKMSTVETFEGEGETRTTKYTTCYVWEDDVAYFAQVFKKRADITLEEFAAALHRIPDENIFAEIPVDANLTVAEITNIPERKLYIKRPRLSEYEEDGDHDWTRQILLQEAMIMERISKKPHPNIVTYYGCRVKDGRLTAIVVARHKSLQGHLQEGRSVDIDAFIDRLESAVRHLHSLGLAHNDLTPSNVLLDDDDMPRLIDFGSCRPFGGRLLQCGTPGWCDGPIFFSDKEHDLSGLERIRKWLGEPDRLYLEYENS